MAGGRPVAGCKDQVRIEVTLQLKACSWEDQLQVSGSRGSEQGVHCSLRGHGSGLGPEAWAACLPMNAMENIDTEAWTLLYSASVNRRPCNSSTQPDKWHQHYAAACVKTAK
eukprot:3215560-Pleurochrysis_carterae.AAC.7